MNVNLDINNDGLYTERNYKQTLILFLTTLLGSVFGIMGAFRGIMRTLENNIINLKQKIGRNSELSDIQKQRNKHKSLIENDDANVLSSNDDKSSNADLISPRV